MATLDDFMKAAVLLAAYPPVKKKPYATKALVRWEDIESMREALESVGVDWREAHEKWGRP